MTLDAVQIEYLERHIKAELAKWRMRGFFPDEGELRRELYVRHLAFFRAGKTYRERLFMAGNRVGKTIAGSYETAIHLTGRYPHWWEGRVFDEPGAWYAAGSTLETTRDIVQVELLGAGEDYGTGMIPAADIDDIKRRPNTNGAVDYAMVKNQNGGFARVNFKSYDQGRKAFEGTAKQGIWLDEEPPQAIYTECLTRTATTQGLIMVTFTPLNGATDVVMDFIENADLVS
jgi:phage terminase large subunit-like protein